MVISGLLVAAGVMAAVGTVSLDRSGAVPRWADRKRMALQWRGHRRPDPIGSGGGFHDRGRGDRVLDHRRRAISGSGANGAAAVAEFTRDRGNQIMLGAFLATFSYGLADWAAEHKTAIRLLVRPGDYVFPGAPTSTSSSPK